MISRCQSQRIPVVVFHNWFVGLIDMATATDTTDTVNLWIRATIHIEHIFDIYRTSIWCAMRSNWRRHAQIIIQLLWEKFDPKLILIGRYLFHLHICISLIFTDNVRTLAAAAPYSLFAPNVCIWDFRLSAITEFLRTSSARIVSRLIVMRRVRIGVPNRNNLLEQDIWG